MASSIASIADAVKSRINTAAAAAALAFDDTDFTAERVYTPLKDLSALEDLQVLVVPSARAISKLSRGAMQADVTIDIGIMKRLSATTNSALESANTEIDALLEFAEQIADLYGAGDTAGGARWLNTENPVIYDPGKMKDEKTFLTVVQLIFKQF